MSRFSNYADPNANPNFCRDWGDGPVHTKLRSEKSKPKQSITKTEDSKAAEPKAAA